MKCPSCNSKRLKVIKTELTLNMRIRRRYCKDCHHTFPTVETILKEKDFYNMSFDGLVYNFEKK